MMHISFSSQRASTHRAFTLIELLVAVSIISLLSSLVLASVNKARDDAKQKTALQFAAQNDRIMGDEAIGMWNFEEGSGTTVRDASGWSNHGTISGATFTTDTYNAGLSKYALSFDGVDDYVSISAPANILTSEGTISAWAYPVAIGINRYVFCAVGSNTSRFYLGYDGGNFSGTRGNPASSSTIKSGAPLNVWQHLVLSWDAATFKVYYNGVQVRSTSYGGLGTSSTARIGAQSNSTTTFSGTIDDVRIYARSLTAQEVKEQYLAGVEKLYANEAIDEEEYRTRLVAIANEHIE